jgi:hypothetical protein
MFSSLEDMITAKFMAEMSAIKDLSDIFKETIEAECMLNNDIVLDNDRFLVRNGSFASPDVIPISTTETLNNGRNRTSTLQKSSSIQVC